MTADVIYDFDNYLADAKVYLATIELDMKDNEDDDTVSYFVDYYVIANNPNQALYSASVAYPDAVNVDVQQTPVSPQQYASRKD